MSKRNDLQFLIDNSNIIHNYKYIYNMSTYNNMHEIQEFLCPEHGIFKTSFHSHFIKQRGCKQCAIDKRRDTLDIFIKKSKETHNNLYDYTLCNYIDSKTKVKIICPIHGIFEQKPNYHILGQGCPICKESKGEKEIRNILELKNIKYETQKTFNDCKNTKLLKFDFYLPELNTCIEFDGEQHYKSFKYFGGDDGFKVIQKRDKIKNDYCVDNNIKLIRIKYNDNISDSLFYI